MAVADLLAVGGFPWVAYVHGQGAEVRMGERRRVRLFRSGRHQAVRIPIGFELPGERR